MGRINVTFPIFVDCSVQHPCSNSSLMHVFPISADLQHTSQQVDTCVDGGMQKSVQFGAKNAPLFVVCSIHLSLQDGQATAFVLLLIRDLARNEGCYLNFTRLHGK